MNTKDLHHYQDRLTALRDRLTSEVTHMVDTVRSSVHPTGEHDGVVSESLGKELVLEGAEEAVRHDVVAALRRIEEGRFGNCERCGRGIAKARLAAVPYARFCIVCERNAEAGYPLESLAGERG
jgi:RNA polymerase-binding transcription factor DksA